MANDKAPIATHQNYGSLGLKLAPNWSRSNYADQRTVVSFIGHEGGDSDVSHKNDPNKEHDFAWGNRRVEDHYEELRARGYRPLLVSEGWQIRADLLPLEIWRVENDMIMKRADFLMVRDKERWLREEQERERKRNRDLDAESNAALAELAAQSGIRDVRGSNGEMLRHGNRERV